MQITAKRPPQPQREFQPIVPPQGPRQHIGIDLVNNKPANEFGYVHILVVVCYLSKFVVACPLKIKTSAEVLAEFRGIYLTFGVPSSIQHDQRKEFTSKVFLDYLVNLSKVEFCSLS